MAGRRVSRGAERLKTPSAGKVSAYREMFSFDTKKEPENSALRGGSFCLPQAGRDAPLGQRQGGVFRLPPPYLWTPPTPQRNNCDRRQRRKQGAVVGAAASKTRVPPKARSGCWVPQPVVKGYTPLTILKKKSKHKKASAAPVGASALTLFSLLHLKPLSRCATAPPRGSWHRAAMTERVCSPKSSKAVRHSPDGLAALIGKDRSGDGNCYFARPSFFSRFHARMTCTLVTRLPGVKAPSPMSGSSPASTAQRAALAVSGSATSL